jgi:hypothetical protein
MIDKTQIYELIKSIPNKDTAKYTTSERFKQDLVDYFLTNRYNSIIEFGSCQGNSTLIYSYLFDSVIGLEFDKQNIIISRERCINQRNVNIIEFNAYSSWDTLPDAHVLNLDAMHDTSGVIHMIVQASIKFPNSIIVMDDYGHEDGTVKHVIDGFINNNSIEVLQWIGEEKGYRAANGKVFIDKEGLIFKFKL